MAGCLRRLILFKPKNLAPSLRPYGQGPPEHIKKAMLQFGREDNVPVYLKGGVGDRILFGFTLFTLALGLMGSAHTFYSLLMGKKK